MKIKVLFFYFWVTYLKLKKKKLRFELLTWSLKLKTYISSYWLEGYTFIVLLSNYELKVKKYQITFEITNWKTEKPKCWSRIMVIRDFFIEMIYYTIQNIWYEKEYLPSIMIM